MTGHDYIAHVDELDELVDDIARLRERVRKLGEVEAEADAEDKLLDVEVLLCERATELRPLADKQARARELAEERQYREARGT